MLAAPWCMLYHTGSALHCRHQVNFPHNNILWAISSWLRQNILKGYNAIPWHKIEVHWAVLHVHYLILLQVAHLGPRSACMHTSLASQRVKGHLAWQLNTLRVEKKPLSPTLFVESLPVSWARHVLQSCLEHMHWGYIPYIARNTQRSIYA